nr:ATP-binding protein [Burkholderia ubonensis]
MAAALLDRLLQHAIVVQIEGTSHRLREHADLLRDSLRNRPSSLNPVPAEPARRRPGRPRRNPFDHVTVWSPSEPGGKFYVDCSGVRLESWTGLCRESEALPVFERTQ